MRRGSAGVSSLLLAIATIAIAEVALGALLVLFSYILNLNLILELGSARLVFYPAITDYVVIEQGTPVIVGGPPTIDLYGAALVASIAFFATFGLAAAARTFRRWRPIA